jgi:hypothetical protein
MEYKTYTVVRRYRIAPGEESKKALCSSIHRCMSMNIRLLAANLNIVCFQFVSPRLTEAAASDLNRELLYRLHETGIAAPSYPDLNGRFAIRDCITNHRTTSEDIALLVQETVRIGSELVKEL